jgi:K+-transporting ATPase ATPase C chain
MTQSHEPISTAAGGEEIIGPRRASLRSTGPTALLMVVVLTVILGMALPFATMGVAQVLFNGQANGSLIKKDGVVVGSTLIGQNFTKLRYFWPRPSVIDYDASTSGGTNFGPTNKTLFADTIKEANLIRRVNDLPKNEVLSADAVSTSASGLDPDISPAYAALQIPRIARVRRLSIGVVKRLVARYTQGRTLGFLGEPRVNVLQLNLALDRTSS